MINSIERTSEIAYKCSKVAILQSNVKILEALNRKFVGLAIQSAVMASDCTSGIVHR